MIQWKFYPQNRFPNSKIMETIEIFKGNFKKINSKENELISNNVLECLRVDLEKVGFKIEKGKKKEDKIKVPVLFGLNGKLEKFFDADGYHETEQIVIEVEAGRAVANYQFLKDLFQASVMQNVKYSIIAVRITYKKQKDFETVLNFIDALYSSEKLKLPLEGILIIGY